VGKWGENIIKVRGPVKPNISSNDASYSRRRQDRIVNPSLAQTGKWIATGLRSAVKAVGNFSSPRYPERISWLHTSLVWEQAVTSLGYSLLPIAVVRECLEFYFYAHDTSLRRVGWRDGWLLYELNSLRSAPRQQHTHVSVVGHLLVLMFMSHWFATQIQRRNYLRSLKYRY
jgi:hypothetical protein